MGRVKLVVLGTIGFDSVKTPFGEAPRVLGGSGSHAAVAASHFVKTGLVSCVGRDFSEVHEGMYRKRGIDTTGLVRLAHPTFSWKAHYDFDVNVAHTDAVNPTILGAYDPVLPAQWKNAPFALLGNILPKMQNRVLDQFSKKPVLSVCDTMNYYISSQPDAVKSTVRRCDIGLMNDAEARQLFDTPSLVKAAREILRLNSKYAIVKKGEHGAVLFTPKTHFAVPGFPLENVVDPTGCGDAFAGGFLGHLAKSGQVSEKNVRKAMVWGSVLASFNAEDFSFNRLLSVRPRELKRRYGEFQKMVLF